MSTSSDIAIVGMAGIFPEAPDVAAFWKNILGKVDAVTEAPPQWSADLVSDPASTAGPHIYIRRGGFLGDLARFNPLEYGVPPRSIEGSDPEHFLALRVAHEALADAGYLDRPFNRARTAVIIGRSTFGNRGMFTAFQHGLVLDQTIRLLATLHPEYPADELARIRGQLQADLPPFSAETAPGLVPSVLCGRIANRLDLMGPAYTVDAACASSLAAVELAGSDLASGKVDMALAGGMQASITYLAALIFCQLGALSRAGAVRSFSPDADGTLLSEGAGILVLKRREDAERAGDRIYALIKAVGMASDGRAVGLLAPRVEGQELAIRRAYDQAGIAARTVSLVEGHGTGTPVGDAIEIEALGRIFDPEGASDAGDGRPVPWCALGSVKSMIGHVIPAAGVAGLIKVALALHHKVLPPTLHAEAGNPKLASTPFYLNTETRPWIHGGPQPRRAAVSAFGFGGINAHAILEEHVEAKPTDLVSRTQLHRDFDAEVIVLSAPSRGELLTRGGELHRLLAGNPDLALVDLAYTLNCPAAAPEVPAARLAVVATSIADLQAKLGHALDRLAEPECHHIDEPRGIYYTDAPLHAPGTLAFLFPGIGNHYVNMLADLCIHFPVVRASFDMTDRIFAEHQPGDGGILPSQLIFPPPGDSTADPALLWSTKYGMAAGLAADLALYRLLSALDIQPDAVLGHSMGEHFAQALVSATWADEADLVRRFTLLNEGADQLQAEGLVPAGALVAITTTDRERVLALVRRSAGALAVAMDNCPHQLVLGGSAEAVTAAVGELERAGMPCMVLPVEHPYHTPAFVPFADQLLPTRYASQETSGPRPSRLTVYSCFTAERCPDEPEAVEQLLSGLWFRPVRFREAIETMYRDGVRIFVEAGPRGSLSSFVADTLSGLPHLAVPSDVVNRTGTTQLAHLVGLLAAHHVPMDLKPLYAHRSPQRLSLAGLAIEGLSTEGGRMAAAAADHAVPLAVHAPLITLPQPVRPVGSRSGSWTEPAGADAAWLPSVMSSPVAAPTQPEGTGRERVMQEYFATMDRFLEVQRHVMGAAPPQADLLPAPAERPRFPLLGSVMSLIEGAELVAIRRFDVDEDLFLHDHTFGRQVSVTDESLLALPVVPLTFSIEMMAEAAASLCPDQVVVGLREVRAYQWIDLDDGHATLRLIARRDPAGEGREVTVELQRMRADAVSADQTGTRVAEGVVLLADSYPAPPKLTPLTLRAERPYAQAGTGLYAEGRMFHGPRFQGVVSLDRWGEDGTEGTMVTLPTRDLFASTAHPALATDPVLLDAAGQLVGFWALERLGGDFIGFPFALAELQLFRPPPAPATSVRGLVRITSAGERQVRADIDLVGPDGLLLGRLVGWSNHILDVLVRALRRRHADSATLGAPWQPLLDGLPAAETFVCWRIGELELKSLAAHGRILQRILAPWILGRQERVDWAGLAGSDQFRGQWLLGRVAAKEALRAVLHECFALNLYPADIAVATDEHGNLVANGHWISQVERVPQVSVAHCAGSTVAIAGADRRCRGVGIHLERLDPTGAAAGRLSLEPAERALLAPLDRPEQREGVLPEWVLRLWCAKQAAGRALGRGPSAVLTVTGLDLADGVVRLSAEPAPAASVTFDSVPLTVHTTRDGDEIAAVAVLWEEPANV